MWSVETWRTARKNPKTPKVWRVGWPKGRALPILAQGRGGWQIFLCGWETLGGARNLLF